MKKHRWIRKGTALALLVATVMNVQMMVYADSLDTSMIQEISLEELKSIGETTKEFELFDKDGDGIWETLRLFDGYETATPAFYRPVWSDELGSIITEVTYEWKGVERYLEIARKYPGELALWEEYQEKSDKLSNELFATQNSMQETLLAESLKSSSQPVEQFAYLVNQIDATYRPHVDPNAQGFTKYSAIADESHYAQYMNALWYYTETSEKLAWLRGEFSLPEEEYNAWKTGLLWSYVEPLLKRNGTSSYEKIIVGSYGYYGTGIPIWYVNGEWYEYDYYNIKLTKGLSEKTKQIIIDEAKDENLSEYGIRMIQFYPEDVRAAMPDKYK